MTSSDFSSPPRGDEQTSTSTSTHATLDGTRVGVQEWRPLGLAGRGYKLGQLKDSRRPSLLESWRLSSSFQKRIGFISRNKNDVANSQHVLNIYQAFIMCKALCFLCRFPCKPYHCLMRKRTCSLPILQMRKLRPTERCQMFSQGHRATTFSAPKPTNYNSSIPSPSFSKHMFGLYVENGLLMCCCTGVSCLWCVRPDSSMRLGILKGSPYNPLEFRYVIFSFLQTLPWCLEPMPPQ